MLLLLGRRFTLVLPYQELLGVHLRGGTDYTLLGSHLFEQRILVEFEHVLGRVFAAQTVDLFLPWASLFNTLQHGGFPDGCLLMNHRPCMLLLIFLKEFGSIESARDDLVDVRVVHRVGDAISPNQQMQVLPHKRIKFVLAQAGAVGGHEEPEGLNQERLHHLHQVELGLRPVVWLSEHLPEVLLGIHHFLVSHYLGCRRLIRIRLRRDWTHRISRRHV